MKKNLVCGAGGFIGNHLVNHLKDEGHFVVGADIKEPEFQVTKADRFVQIDLTKFQLCEYLFKTYEFDEVYQLAAQMGGSLYIFSGDNDAVIMHDSALINLNIANLCVWNDVPKVFFSSSACIYPQELQISSDSMSLSEDDAYPASPDSEYGWEKIFSERLYLAHARNYSMNVRIARFHNVFGELGTYTGGRQKAPADICRKVAEAKNGSSIQINGDGEQTRSFLYIDECIEGIQRLMDSNVAEPLNLGSSESISINALAQMVIDISGKELSIEHVPSNSTGVRGRNSDNTLIREKLGWAPSLPLIVGMERLYRWIDKQINI